MGVEVPSNPINRKEQYLAKIAGQAVEIPEEPLTREEAYLDKIAKNGSGGGGGTSDYNLLSNKPQIAGTELQGNKSLADLGIASAQSVSNITNGESINNFADVETALAGKQATLTFDNVPTENSTNPVKSGGVYFALSAKEDAFTAGDYLKLTNGTLSVQKSKGDDLYAYKFITTSTADVRPSVKIQRYINGVFQSETNYINDDVRDNPVTLDNLLTLAYGIGGYYWQYTLLENSNQHNKNDVVRWEYRTVVDYEETFDVPQQDTSKNLVLQEDLTSALADKQNASDNNLDTDAKTIVGAINEHEGDIDSLKSGLTNLDNEVNGDATTYPYADVITVSDAIPANLADCSVKIEPVQDLHGYDKPWVGGAGKNKLPLVLADLKTANTDGTWNDNAYTLNGVAFTVLMDSNGNVIGIRANGTASSNTYIILERGNLQKYGAMVLNGCPSGGSGSTYNVKVQKATGDYAIYATDAGNGATISDAITSDDSIVYISISSGYNAQNLIFYPMLRLSTETDSTFAPYTNICPISGHTEAVVTRDGKNLLEGSTEGATATSSGTPGYPLGTLNARTGYFPQAGKYTFSFKGSDSYGTFIVFVNNVEIVHYNGFVSGKKTITVPNPGKFRIEWYVNGAYTIYNPMIEYGEEKTTYTPYVSPKTYTLALGDTIYGGTVDFDSGVMTVDRASVDLGTLTYSRVGTDTEGKLRFKADLTNAKPVSDSSKKPNALCSEYDVVTPNDTYACIDGVTIGTTGDFRVYVDAYNNSSASDFKSAMDGVQFCYELATPLTVQLTTTQIQLLQGQNTLYASTGQISVTVNGVSGAIGEVQEQVNGLDAKVPDAPSTDGTYSLQVTVSSGTPTYSWVSTT